MLCAKEKRGGRSRVARRTGLAAVAPPSFSEKLMLLLPRETVRGSAAAGRSGVTIAACADGDEPLRVRGEIRREGLSAATTTALAVAVVFLFVLDIFLLLRERKDMKRSEGPYVPYVGLLRG